MLTVCQRMQTVALHSIQTIPSLRSRVLHCNTGNASSYMLIGNATSTNRQTQLKLL